MIFLLFLFAVVNAELEVKVEYSLDDWATSTPLGHVSLHSIEGNYTGSFHRSKESANLAQLLYKKKDAVYRTRSFSTSHPSRTVESSSSPCLILRSRLMHELFLSISPRTHSLLSSTVFPDPLFLTHEECPEVDSSITPHATVVVAVESPLPSPDTQSYLEKIEKEKRARQHGAENDNRSFLAKYWMYIVPVVIFFVISNAAGGDEGGER